MKLIPNLENFVASPVILLRATARVARSRRPKAHSTSNAEQLSEDAVPPSKVHKLRLRFEFFSLLRLLIN
eukprot:6194380-Pleurochrysis_carterae.AAC.1